MGDTQWQIFDADFVERANYAAFEDAPNPFNCIGVDRTGGVLTLNRPRNDRSVRRV